MQLLFTISVAILYSAHGSQYTHFIDLNGMVDMAGLDGVTGVCDETGQFCGCANAEHQCNWEQEYCVGSPGECRSRMVFPNDDYDSCPCGVDEYNPPSVVSEGACVAADPPECIVGLNTEPEAATEETFGKDLPWDATNGKPAWVEHLKTELNLGTNDPTWDGTQAGKDLFQSTGYQKSTAMARSKATFEAYATDYKGKMDKVQNGIEGLAQLHSTHDEMWHRICAIAERGAKHAMVEFQKAILEFKRSMLVFRDSHTEMLQQKATLETEKQDMIKALQKWLTARKAHTHAHVRYVNFLHHLGLNFNDKNPAARYWREYAHGETGRPEDAGGVVGGWTPSRGPSSLVGKHSHAAFIDSLESVAVDTTQGTNGLTVDGVMTRPFYNHMMRGSDNNNPNWQHEPTNDISHSELYQLSQAGKDGGVTDDNGLMSVEDVNNEQVPVDGYVNNDDPKGGDVTYRDSIGAADSNYPDFSDGGPPVVAGSEGLQR